MLTRVLQPAEHDVLGRWRKRTLGIAIEAKQFTQHGEARIALGLGKYQAGAGRPADLGEFRRIAAQLRTSANRRAALCQQMLAQLPGTINIMVLLQRIGIGHEPKKIVTVFAKMRGEISPQSDVRQRQREVARRQRIMQARIGRPGVFPAGKHAPQRLSIAAVDQQPEKRLLDFAGIRGNGQCGLQIAARGFGLSLVQPVSGRPLEKIGLLAQFGQTLRSYPGEQFAHGMPVFAGGVVRQRQAQMTRLAKTRPGLGGNAGGLMRITVLQQGIKCIVITYERLATIDEAPIRGDGPLVLRRQLRQFCRQPPERGVRRRGRRLCLLENGQAGLGLSAHQQQRSRPHGGRGRHAATGETSLPVP